MSIGKTINSNRVFYNSIYGKNVKVALDGIISGVGKPLYPGGLTDPALDSITQSMVDNYGGVIITLTTTGNNQTLPAPTDTSKNPIFTIINNDTSTHSIDIIGASTVILDPGERKEFQWDVTAWIASDASGLWRDNGVDLFASNSTRHIDLQNGGLKDVNVTNAINLGSATDTSLDTTKKDILGGINELLLNSVKRSEWLQNGIVDKSESTITFVNGTRTFTINRTGGSFSYFLQGVKYTVTTDDVSTVNNVIIADTEGKWIIYYDGVTLTALNNPSHSQIEDVIMTKCFVAQIYWDETNKLSYLYEERHGYQMSPRTHKYLHKIVGMAYTSGLALADFVISDGADNEDAQFSIASGECYDEDLKIDLNTINKTTGNSIFYRDGSNWRWTTQTGFKCMTFDGTSGTRLAWDNAGTLTEVTDNKFVLIHIFATNCVLGNCITIIGQAEYSNIISARNGAETEISNLVLGSLFSEEMKPIATIIYQTKDSYTNDVNARVVQTDAGEDYIDWRRSQLSAGVSAGIHGSLGGLGNDDHSQYALLVGRSGGQILVGSVDASEHLRLQSTSNGTKGNVFLGSGSDFYFDETNGKLVVGAGSVAHPSIAFGDGDSGFYEPSDDSVWLSLSGGVFYKFNQTYLQFGPTGGNPGVMHEITSATNPVFVPIRDNAGTGVGSASSTSLSLIANSIEGLRINSALAHSVAGIANYETLVTNDDDIPNKKYVDDSILTKDTFLELTDTISSYNAGRIPFEGASGILDNLKLFWDNANKRLGINTDVPLNTIGFDGGITRTTSLSHGTAASGHINLGYESETGTLGQNLLHPTVGGGKINVAGGSYSTIAGGFTNTIIEYGSAICGGFRNIIEETYSFIGGGADNLVKGSYATILGGINNLADKNYSTVGGGENNQAKGINSTIGGGKINVANSNRIFIGGGIGNIATGEAAVLCGGNYNKTNGISATVCGGWNCESNAHYATICGGHTNVASGTYSFIGGGSNNAAVGTYSFIGGGKTHSAGGAYSTVIGGSLNKADADYSLVGGKNMQLDLDALHTFVWGHSETAQIISTPNAFLIFPASPAGKMGISVVNPVSKLHIDQSVDDAAFPVMTLDQADVSEGFIDFLGSARGVITESTNSVDSIRVELNGTVYRLALYADA